MNKENHRVAGIVYEAVDEYNQELPADEQLDKSLDCLLYGKSGKLDSLGLVNLIVLIERKVEEEYGVPIMIADERAMSQERSPFRTIGRLVEYISMLLEENRLE
jgi:acyl carrier protein